MIFHFLSFSIFFIQFAVGVQPISKKILIIHSYPDGDWSSEINTGVTNSLSAEHISASLQSEVFHAKYWMRQPAKEQTLEKDRLISLITNVNPSALVLADDEVTDFILPKILESNFNIPIFLTAINKPIEQLTFYNESNKKNIAIVLEEFPEVESLKVLQTVAPKAKNIGIVSSNHPSSKLIVDVLQKDFQENVFIKSNFSLKKVSIQTFWTGFQSELLQFPSRVDAFWLPVPYDVRNENNTEVAPQEIGKWIKDHIPVISMGITDLHFEMGFAINVVLRPREIGKSTAGQIIRYFRGESLEKIGVEKCNSFNIRLNKEAFRRLKISIPKVLEKYAEEPKRKTK